MQTVFNYFLVCYINKLKFIKKIIGDGKICKEELIEGNLIINFKLIYLTK